MSKPAVSWSDSKGCVRLTKRALLCWHGLKALLRHGHTPSPSVTSRTMPHSPQVSRLLLGAGGNGTRNWRDELPSRCRSFKSDSTRPRTNCDIWRPKSSSTRRGRLSVSAPASLNNLHYKALSKSSRKLPNHVKESETPSCCERLDIY